MAPKVQPKCFWREAHKQGYLIRFGHTEALLYIIIVLGFEPNISENMILFTSPNDLLYAAA